MILVRQMIKKIHDVDINYINYGNNKGESIVLLHGWGQNIAMMKPLGDPLKKILILLLLIYQVLAKVKSQKQFGL